MSKNFEVELARNLGREDREGETQYLRPFRDGEGSMTPEQFEHLTNRLAAISKTLGSINFMLVWVVILLAAGRCPNETAAFSRLRRIDRLCHHASLLSRKLQHWPMGSNKSHEATRALWPAKVAILLTVRADAAKD